MKLSDYIRYKVDRLESGYVFTYHDFMRNVDEGAAVMKALNRMASAGEIAKLSKGKYYKPETTMFGPLYPSQFQVVKDLLEDSGKIVGYLTGLSIYNKFGLTTQVSNTIQIAKNYIRPSFKRDRYTVSFVRQKNTITKDNIHLLQLLDVIRYIRKIPDTTINLCIKRILNMVNDLREDDKSTLARLAMKYPASTRSLLGALLEVVGENNLAFSLRKSLNPITTYKINGVKDVVAMADKWNIK